MSEQNEGLLLFSTAHLEEEIFATPSYALEDGAAQRAFELAYGGRPQDPRSSDFDRRDSFVSHERVQMTNQHLDFRKFGHAAKLTIRRIW